LGCTSSDGPRAPWRRTNPGDRAAQAERDTRKHPNFDHAPIALVESFSEDRVRRHAPFPMTSVVDGRHRQGSGRHLPGDGNAMSEFRVLEGAAARALETRPGTLNAAIIDDPSATSDARTAP